jgi:hypothetical protein
MALVLVGGVYTSLNCPTVERLRRWVQEGGTLITIQP